MITQRIVASGCVVAAGLMYFFGTGHEYSEAYVFPNLLAIVMVVLASIMAITADIDPKTQKSLAISSVPWIKLWPAFLVIIVYMLIAEYVGFFVSSFLVFVLLGNMYSQRVDVPFLINRCVPIAFVFLSLLYGLFVLLLKVQMPDGILF